MDDYITIYTSDIHSHSLFLFLAKETLGMGMSGYNGTYAAVMIVLPANEI